MSSKLPLLWMGIVLSVACGGGAESAPSPTESTVSSGAEATSAAEREPAQTTIADEEVEAPPPVAEGPAQITVVAKVGNDTVTAPVKVLGDDGAVMVEGTTGSPITVQAGSLTLEVSITDSAVMIDTPTVREQIEVEPGDSRNIELRIPRALVKVTVSVNGKPDTKATVTLLRHGAIVTTLTSGAPDFVPLTPGRYSAKVKAKNAEIDVPDVVIPEDSQRNIPLNVSL